MKKSKTWWLSTSLSIILFLLIYFLRVQQGGIEFEIDLLISQREFLDQRIAQSLPSPQAELLSGILLGQNKDLPGQLRLALRDTSTLHIVVASGQNLSMLAGFFLSLAGLLKRRTAMILGLGAAIFYAFLTGFQIPILRAAIMFTLASVAALFGRKGDGVRVLLIVAATMLLINPNWITSLSFQLSFLATFGVIAVAPILMEKLKFVPIVGQDLAVSLAAQLMVMPVIAQNFHQISLVSLITNVLVLWTIPFIMILGVLTLIIPPVAILVNILLSYFLYIVQFFASLPFAWEYIGEQAVVVWIGYYLVVAGILIMLSLNNGQAEDSREFAKGS